MGKSKSGLYHNGGKGMFVANYKRTTIIPADTSLTFSLSERMVWMLGPSTSGEKETHLLPAKFVVNEDI